MVMKYARPERRKFPRLGIPLLILYRLETNDPFAIFKAISRNMGGQGLMFETEKPLPIGSRLCLDIYQPSVKYKDLIFLLSAQAKVIWVKKKEDASRMIGTNKYQIGIEFVKIEKENKDRIIEYVKRIEKGW